MGRVGDNCVEQSKPSSEMQILSFLSYEEFRPKK
jgi:hypothetical protein